jgi:hypothetical protein
MSVDVSDLFKGISKLTDLSFDATIPIREDPRVIYRYVRRLHELKLSTH